MPAKRNGFGRWLDTALSTLLPRGMTTDMSAPSGFYSRCGARSCGRFVSRRQCWRRGPIVGLVSRRRALTVRIDAWSNGRRAKEPVLAPDSSGPLELRRRCVRGALARRGECRLGRDARGAELEGDADPGPGPQPADVGLVHLAIGVHRGWSHRKHRLRRGEGASGALEWREVVGRADAVARQPERLLGRVVRVGAFLRGNGIRGIRQRLIPT